MKKREAKEVKTVGYGGTAEAKRPYQEARRAVPWPNSKEMP